MPKTLTLKLKVEKLKVECGMWTADISNRPSTFNFSPSTGGTKQKAPANRGFGRILKPACYRFMILVLNCSEADRTTAL